MATEPEPTPLVDLVFVHDPDRQIYGEWVFGWWCTGPDIATAVQATMQRVVF